MIVSKSQSQATLPEERSRRLTSARLAIASFITAAGLNETLWPCRCSAGARNSATVNAKA